jgi:hypothetical protein
MFSELARTTTNPFLQYWKSFLDMTVGAYSAPPLIGAALVQLAANRRI